MAFNQQNGYNTQVLGQHLSVGSRPGVRHARHDARQRRDDAFRQGSPTRATPRARRSPPGAPERPEHLGLQAHRAAHGQQHRVGRTYWAAISVYVYDWGTLSSSDQALYGIQLHSGDDSAGYSPSFAIYTVGNGRRFNVQARQPVSRARTERTTPSRTSRSAAGWTSCSSSSRTPSGTGFLQVWMDGMQIVNHTGNLGYVTPGRRTTSSSATTTGRGRASSSTRKVLLRSPTIVADPTGNKYKPEDLRAHVNAR